MIGSTVRKICIGPDYKDSMRYTVGQSILRGSATIEYIEYKRELKEADIYITKIDSEDEVYIWKTISDVPFIVEYNIDF